MADPTIKEQIKTLEEDLQEQVDLTNEAVIQLLDGLENDTGIKLKSYTVLFKPVGTGMNKAYTKEISAHWD